jgi:hypothetical protein
MKGLTLKLVLPITIISFALFTKWWYALPVDAPETMYTGFPLIYAGPGWHTSLSFQIFIAEFFVDFLVYFLCWFLLTYTINRFWFTIKMHRVASIALWLLSILLIIGWSFIISIGDNIYYPKRPYNIKVMETGYKFFWQHTQRPD